MIDSGANIIETLDRTLRMVMHMRDKQPAENYRLQARIYYAHIDDDMKRQMVDELVMDFAAIPGTEKYWPSAE